jgi:hypothetical protein
MLWQNAIQLYGCVLPDDTDRNLFPGIEMMASAADEIPSAGNRRGMDLLWLASILFPGQVSWIDLDR